MKKLNSKIFLLNLFIIFLLIFLPYYLFQGKLFVGGDDTRLMYSYPLEYFKTATLYSWNHFSNFGWNFPPQSFVPFLSVWIILENVLKSKIILSYLSFSMPLIFGLIYFQKLIKEFVNEDRNYDIQILLGSLFYIFSPIIAYQLLFVFLTSAWLICLIPIIFYYFIKYLKSTELIYLIKPIIIFTFLSFVTLSVPWVLGFILPLFFVIFLLFFFFSRKEIIIFIKRFLIFFGILSLSQSFWLIGYLMTYIQVSSNSFAAKVFSQGFQDTFTPTINSTAKGVVFYPLLNLINRHMAFDFSWDLKYVFLQYYDKTIVFNLIFIFTLLLGIVNFKKHTFKNEKRIFLIFLTTFVLLLFLITVNIGPLKDIFILMRHIPAFTMFRNFYDKFSVGYVFCYSVLITFCLIIVRRRFEKSKKIASFLIVFFSIAVLINIIPLKKTVNAPIWQTSNIYKTITFPQEYLTFMKNTGKLVSPNNNILSIPFGSAAYTVVKDQNSTSAYVGTSPVILFSGVDDISGHLSFNFTKEADTIDSLIVNRNYNEFRKTLFNHNINYLILTKNVPTDLIDTYLFNRDLYEKQDKEFINAIAGERLLTSDGGNYELYKLKNQNNLISSKNLLFKRVNPAKYRIYIKNLKKPQDLSYFDSYHEGWKLYLQKNPNLSFCGEKNTNKNNTSTECSTESRVYQNEDIINLLKKSVFENTHNLENGFSNKWVIDPEYVKKNFDQDYYKVNRDGSIDIELVLYFQPQSYFYLGIIVSIATFLLLAILYMRSKGGSRN